MIWINSNDDEFPLFGINCFFVGQFYCVRIVFVKPNIGGIISDDLENSSYLDSNVNKLLVK